MRGCRRIEPLLYLCRTDEVTDRERQKVDEHIRSCPRCRSILQQLLEIDTAAGLERATAPHFEGSQIIENVLREITPRARQTATGSSISEVLLSRLRPTLGLAVLVAAAVLVVQQTRDAIMLANLENRLRVHGKATVAGPSLAGRITSALFNNDEGEERQGNLFSMRGSEAAADPLQPLRRSLTGLFHHQNGMIEDLAERYPGLSTITLDDGIDERERKILDTEGRAFLKEFEQLIREGAEKP